GAPPVAALVGLERDNREHAVGSYELAVAQRDHPCHCPNGSGWPHNGRVGEEEFEVTSELVEALDQVISERSVVSLYQPIVDISARHPQTEITPEQIPVVAYEALARGPKGSAVEYPDKLFGTARACG